MTSISLSSVVNFVIVFTFASMLTFGASPPVRAQDGTLAPCMSCHVEGEIVLLAEQMPAEQREKLLDAYLMEHFAPDSSIRAEIVSYVISEIEKKAIDLNLEEQR